MNAKPLTRLALTIDEQVIEVEEGTSILQAARHYGIEIPTLCDYPFLPSHGSCRMCVVEIQGRPNTPTACTTPVETGMVVRTQSPKLQALRSELLQMLLADHPSACLVCPENGNCEECMITLRKASVTTGCRSCAKDKQCELQTLAGALGVRQVNYPIRYRMLGMEKEDPFFDRDYNLCVLCGRCIRACTELHFASTLAYTRRGSETVVGTAFGQSHLEAGCTFCGACVEACPTGALTEKARKWDGKPDGEILTTCPLCSIGCSLRLLTKKGQVVGSLAVHTSAQDALCVKGRFGFTEMLNHPSRLLQPEKMTGGARLPISWEEAIEQAAEKLAACPPDQFELRISPDSSNEDLFIAQKFTRLAMKSIGIRATVGESYPGGLNPLLELVKASASLDEIERASSILCVGLDGRFAQSVVEVRLHQAVKRGARLIAVRPEMDALSLYADCWLAVEEGGELGVLEKLAWQKNMVTRRKPPYQPETRIDQAARILRENGSLLILSGPALLAHPQKGRVLAALKQLEQQLGARTVALPAEGNLLGSFVLGAYPELLPGKVNDRPDVQTGVNDQDRQVLYLVGAQPPKFEGRRPYVIYQNFIRSENDNHADLILPSAAFSEADGSRLDYAGQVQPLRKAVPPPGEARPGWEILCAIARTMGVPGFDFASAEEIRAEIVAQVAGFAMGSQVDRSYLSPVFYDHPRQPIPGVRSLRELIYAGLPLTEWVEGLRMLFPEDGHG